MPRKPREYLLRFAEQADNDINRAFERLELLVTAYSSPRATPEGTPTDADTQAAYAEAESHPEHAKYVRLIQAQLVQAKEWLTEFRARFM